jgi:hypothetical protein
LLIRQRTGTLPLVTAQYIVEDAARRAPACWKSNSIPPFSSPYRGHGCCSKTTIDRPSHFDDGRNQD